MQSRCLHDIPAAHRGNQLLDTAVSANGFMEVMIICLPRSDCKAVST